MMRLGIAPINWSNDDLHELGGDIPFEQCLEEMHAASYAGTELGHKFPRDPRVLKNALAHHGLQLASGWHSTHFIDAADPERELAAFKSHLEFLRATGSAVANVAECSRAVHAGSMPLSKRPRFTPAEWKKLAHALNHAGALARMFDIKLAYHHHMGTGVQSAEDVDWLMEMTEPALVYLLLDTGHLTFAGDNPLALLKKHAARVAHVHLKDVRREILYQAIAQDWPFLTAVKAGIFTVPGDGMIGFKEIFSTLRQCQYEGWLIVEAEQDPAKANPLRYAKLAREYLKMLV